MRGNRDDVISSFVRSKIRAWRDEGKELQDLAAAAGFAKSTPSQVLLGTGVGGKTGPKFAKAFGYTSFDAMKRDAWEWWKSQGQAGQELVAFPKTAAMAEAIESVLALKQGTREHLETILSAFGHPRFRARDRDWWVMTLLAELARDRETNRVDRSQREAASAAEREASAKRNEVRSLHERQRRAHTTPKKRSRSAAAK